MSCPAIEVDQILKAINVPTLVMQGDDNQVVPYKDAALLQAKLLKNSALKVYPGYPHGMCTTNADMINSDCLLSYIRDRHCRTGLRHFQQPPCFRGGRVVRGLGDEPELRRPA